MNLLITAAATPLGRQLADGLRQTHRLRLTDPEELATDLEFVRSDLGHDEATDRLVAGIDAIVHPGYLPRPDDGPVDWIDANTRRTYNLLLAASEAGVGRVIYLSTLDLFLPYDEDMTVGEDWRPRPTCEPELMGPYLGEFIAREFAHEHALNLLIFRLGHVVTEEEAQGQPFDPMWVDIRDVVGAIDDALGQEPHQFGIRHFQHQSERSRFVRRSHHHRHHHHTSEYTPQFNFEEHA